MKKLDNTEIELKKKLVTHKALRINWHLEVFPLYSLKDIFPFIVKKKI